MDLFILTTTESKKLYKDEDLEFLKDIHVTKVKKNHKFFKED